MARKVFIFFLGLSVVGLILMTLIFSLVDAQSFIQGLNPSGKEIILSRTIVMLELAIISTLASLCLLLAIFSTASFIPIMLEKGNIDLFLSKPISRSQLIWGKYFGGLIVIFLNILFLIIGVWLIISIKFSYWDFSFLLVSFGIIFTFAVLYALIIFFGIISKSSIPGMMAAYFIFIILSPVLFALKSNLNSLVRNDFVKTIIEGIYYIIPKTSELMGKMNLDLASGKGIDDFQPVLSSFLFLILTMWFSIFLFKKKDF